MKVLAILIVAVSSASALGSGPYLPSGWRPEGPAFFLPNEVQSKPSENPLKETLFQETEASASDFLREYGPPKVQEVSQDITQQGLPDVVTEQAFAAVQAKINQEVVNEEIKEAVEAVTEKEASTVALEAITVTEQISTVAEELETATEDEEETSEQPREELQGRAIKLEVEASVAETTDGFVEAAVVTESDLVVTQQQENANEQSTEQNSKIEEDSEAKTTVKQITEGNESNQQDTIAKEVKSVVEETTNESVDQTVQVLEEEVKNIAQQIIKIENEAVQEQSAGVSGVKTVQVSGSLEQVPEGFLEYGPPGFREYGPPKGDDLLRSSAVQEKSETDLIEKNETRRRRFSPKFRATKKH